MPRDARPATAEDLKRVKRTLLVLPDKVVKDLDPSWFLEDETIRVATSSSST